MVMRTSYRVECRCGDAGAIRMSDFDVDGMALWDRVFAAMKPTCPVCSNRLTPDDLRSR